MSVPLRYGEPDWDEPPCHGPGHGEDIRQRPLSNKNYEELRYEATQRQWASKFVDLNTMALTSNPNVSFVNLRNLTDTVEVIVGEGDDQARWVLHSSLLTNDSKLASMALSRDFKEKNERIIRFPEEDPGVFGQYVTFLYAKMVFVFALETLVQMYTLGDRLQSVKFTNACYETIDRSTDPYTAYQIKYIFDNTYTDDRLRKLCIAQVGKGILDGRYSFSIPHEQELLKDFMPELMLGVTAEVQKRRVGGEKWYPKPQPTRPASSFLFGRPPASPQYSPTTPAAPLFGAAPARPAPGGLFTGTGFGRGAGDSGTGLFGGPRPVPSGGDLFGSGRTPYPPTTNRNDLFGNPVTATSASGGNGGDEQRGGTTSSSSGGLFGTRTANAGEGGLFGTRTVNAGGGGLFADPTSSHANQHPNNAGPSSKSLFGNARPIGGSLFGAAPNPPAANNNPFSLFEQRSQPQSGYGNPPAISGSQGEVQSNHPQHYVNGSGNTGVTATEASLTAANTSQAPSHTSSAAQRGPSLFNNASTASPFAASPAPNGPPVFSFPATAPMQTQQEKQTFTASFSFGPSTMSSASAAPQSAPKMWTVRNDSPQPQGVTSTGSQQNGTVENTNGNNGEFDEDSADASTLAALEKAAAINQPTHGYVPYIASNYVPTNGPKFGTSPFHQLMSGKSPAEGPNPFGQRANGWRPAENGQPSRITGSKDATDGHENDNEDGKGKKPAADDFALSRDFMTMAFPGNQDLTSGNEEYLKNSHGGKVTKDDKLSPTFAEYLEKLRLEKAKANGSAEHNDCQGHLEDDASEALAHKGPTSDSQAKHTVVPNQEDSKPSDDEQIDYEAIEAEMAAAELEEARREEEFAKKKAAEREVQRKREEEEAAAYEALMIEAEHKAEELEAMREQERDVEAAAEYPTNGNSERAAATNSNAEATTAGSAHGSSNADLENARQKLRGFGARIL